MLMWVDSHPGAAANFVAGYAKRTRVLRPHACQNTTCLPVFEKMSTVKTSPATMCCSEFESICCCNSYPLDVSTVKKENMVVSCKRNDAFIQIKV